MSYCTRTAFIIGVLLIAVPAQPQNFALPHFDGISVFMTGQRFSPGSSWQIDPGGPLRWGDVPAQGWGFETHYLITPDPNDPNDCTKRPLPGWSAQLALGYENVDLHGTLGGRYQLFGSIQTIPSFALYLIREGRWWGAYVSLGSGILKLNNMRLYDPDGKIYAVAGDTWRLSASAGVHFNISQATCVKPGASLFAEIGYEERDFASVGYTLPPGKTELPADLPRSLRASGAVINWGLEVDFMRPKPHQ